MPSRVYRPRYRQKHTSKTSGTVTLRRDTICHSVSQGCENSVLSRYPLILNPLEFRSDSISDTVDNTKAGSALLAKRCYRLRGLRHQSRYVPTTSRVWASLIRRSKLGDTTKDR